MKPINHITARIYSFSFIVNGRTEHRYLITTERNVNNIDVTSIGAIDGKLSFVQEAQCTKRNYEYLFDGGRCHYFRDYNKLNCFVSLYTLDEIHQDLNANLY